MNIHIIWHCNIISSFLKGRCAISGAKLAPIFAKRSSAKLPKSPVLSSEEIEARRVRREFLVSGIPEELKRQQEASQSLAFCPTPAPWPVESHIQQRPSDFQELDNVWNLPDVQLPIRQETSFDISPIRLSSSNLGLGDLQTVTVPGDSTKTEVIADILFIS